MVGYSFLDDSFIRDSMPVYPGAICPFRRLHTFCLLRPARYYPRFWIWRPSFGRQRDFNPPEQRAAQLTLPGFRRFGRPPRRRISLQCQLGNLHWQDFHLLDHQFASLHYPGNTLERVHLIRRALSVGSSLAKLTTLLKIRDQGRSSLPPGTRYSPVETYGSQRKHQGVGRAAQAARTDSCKIGSETQERTRKGSERDCWSVWQISLYRSSHQEMDRPWGKENGNKNNNEDSSVDNVHGSYTSRFGAARNTTRTFSTSLPDDAPG